MKKYILLIFLIIVLSGALIAQIILFGNNPTSPEVSTDNSVAQVGISATATPTTSPTATTTPNPTITVTEIATATPTVVPTTYATAPKEITRGNTSKKQMIFTFDCGSSDLSGEKILQVAKDNNVKVTFFVTGQFAGKYSALVKKMADAGHDIYNHSYTHPHFPQISDELVKDELNRTEELVKSLTGKSTKPYFRLPYGDHGNPPSRVWNIAYSQGYQSVFWSVDALDWNAGKQWNGSLVDASFVKKRIYDKIGNGTIVLMHVGDSLTGEVLNEVFTKVQADGYKIVPLSKGL